MEVDLSIIVPVYNVRDYLKECLESVISLEGFAYEIIIVNDGSTDGSEEVVLLYEKYPFVHVIHQENSGLSSARNAGLRKAKGKYVYFLDSDDYVDSRSFEKLFLQGMREDGVEVITGNYFEYWDANQIEEDVHRIEVQKKLVAAGSVFLKKYYLHKISSVVWRSIYAREFLFSGSFFFKEGIYFEDVDWTIGVYTKAKKVCYVPINFYYYRKRDGSIMKSNFSKKKLEDSIYVCKDLIQESKRISDRKIRDIYNMAGLHCLFLGLALYEGEFTNELKEKISAVLRMSSVRKCNYRMMLCIYFFLPPLFHVLLRKKFGK